MATSKVCCPHPVVARNAVVRILGPLRMAVDQVIYSMFCARYIEPALFRSRNPVSTSSRRNVA